MAINHQPKENTDTDQDLIAEFIANGGKITQCKTKEMPSELGISNNTWNNKLTKAERASKEGKVE
jgi:hypothetical protein